MSYQLLINGNALNTEAKRGTVAVHNRHFADIARQFDDKRPAQYLGVIRPQTDGTWSAVTANGTRCGQFNTRVAAAERLDADVPT